MKMIIHSVRFPNSSSIIHSTHHTLIPLAHQSQTGRLAGRPWWVLAGRQSPARLPRAVLRARRLLVRAILRAPALPL